MPRGGEVGALPFPGMVGPANFPGPSFLPAPWGPPAVAYLPGIPAGLGPQAAVPGNGGMVMLPDNVAAFDPRLGSMPPEIMPGTLVAPDVDPRVTRLPPLSNVPHQQPELEFPNGFAGSGPNNARIRDQSAAPGLDTMNGSTVNGQVSPGIPEAAPRATSSAPAQGMAQATVERCTSTPTMINIAGQVSNWFSSLLVVTAVVDHETQNTPTDPSDG